MSAVIGEWHFRPGDFDLSPIRVPYINVSANHCPAQHSESWRCSRRGRHTGRHAAVLYSGDVVAVWR